MNNILFSLLEIIVMFSTLAVMRYLIPYFKIRLSKIIDEFTFAEILKEVKSVEQTILGSKQGTAKKEEVIIRITNFINNHGIKITQKQISDMIEAAVYVMKHEREKNA